MPSIPQSLLWISLVVLWLFVLVPMLISKRDAVRRTSDVALATRVLNGSRERLLRRTGPAAGHRSDPDWRPTEDHLDDADLDDESMAKPGRSVAVATVDDGIAEAESDYLDVDIVEEDSGALPVGASAAAEADHAHYETRPTVGDDRQQDEYEYEYEYVDDSSGLEAPSETDLALADSLSAARRKRYDSSTAEVVSARKYQFRKRMLAAMGVVLVMSATAGFLVSPDAWWGCGSAAVVTLLYLAYLRRQTRIEQRLRRRRAQRMARSRLGVENTEDENYDVVPSRLRRPGSVVLEIDDEDPIFEHLDHAPFARHFDMPRAAGQ